MLVRSLTQQASRRSSTYSHFLRPIPTVGFFTSNTASAPFTTGSFGGPIASSSSSAFSTSATRHEPSIPIVSWSASKRSEHEIQIKEEQTGEVVKPLEGDLQRSAKPLDSKVFAKLSPTLSKFTLPGKVAVVTGAGRGLGFNMAQGLAEVGVRGIAILDVQQDIGDRAAQELGEQTGVDVRFYRVDVRDDKSVRHAVQDVVDHFGEINILINAAGIADSNIKAQNYPLDKFRRLLDINITGTFIAAQACAQAMIKTGSGGSIINIASMSASIVNYPQEQCAYNASKAGVLQLTKSLAAEWAKHGIRVNTISPGYMDTALNRVPALDAQKCIWIDHTPQKRLGSVDELNGLAVYLASDASGYMTGNDCVIDGGYTLW